MDLVIYHYEGAEAQGRCHDSCTADTLPQGKADYRRSKKKFRYRRVHS